MLIGLWQWYGIRKTTGRLYIYRTLVPQLGIKPMTPSVEVPCLNYQTTREFPQNIFLKVQNVRK